MLEEIRKKSKHTFDYWNVIVRALAISTVNSKYNKIDSIINVNPFDVIVTLWNKARYDSLKRADINQVIKNHPPSLVGYKLINGKVIYIPNDGNHRIIVAMERGVETIPARVGVIYEVGAGEILIDNIGVWFKREENEYSLVTNLNDTEKEHMGTIVYLLSSRGYNPIVIR